MEPISPASALSSSATSRRLFQNISWSTHETTYFNDLLPLPYTQATLAQVCEHIHEVRDAIGRRILIENPSTYVAFASSTMSETDFIQAITAISQCWRRWRRV
jgi:uncharacterized protein (UPF0276 family)